MTAHTAIPVRRAAVAEMLRRTPGISARAIAAQLGVGKDTIRRDIAENESAQRQQDAATGPETPEPAPPAVPTAPPAHGQMDGRPGWIDGDLLVIRLDEPMRQALATIRAAKDQQDWEIYNVAAARGGILRLAKHYRQANGTTLSQHSGDAR
jgi:hypothetical protein